MTVTVCIRRSRRKHHQKNQTLVQSQKGKTGEILKTCKPLAKSAKVFTVAQQVITRLCLQQHDNQLGNSCLTDVWLQKLSTCSSYELLNGA